MKVTPTSLPDVLLIEPQVFGDERGFFFESFNARTFAAATALKPTFVHAPLRPDFRCPHARRLRP